MTEDELQAEVDKFKEQNATLAKDLKAARSEAKEATSEVASLKAQTEKLNTDYGSLWEKHKEVRDQLKDRRHNVDAMTAQLETLTAERDEWKTKAESSTPEAYEATIAELRGEIRGTKHRQAFEAVAKTLKVSDPARIADLYALSGYKPDADEIDEAKLTTVIGDALKGRPWYLDAEAATTPDPVAGQPATQQPAAEAATKPTPEGGTTKPEGGGATNGTAKIQTPWGHAKPPAQPVVAAAPGPGSDRGQSVTSGQPQPQSAWPLGRI